MVSSAFPNLSLCRLSASCFLFRLIFGSFPLASSFQSSGLSHNQRSTLLLRLGAASSVPPPPWNFQVSRIFYQFQAIPVDNARQFCPPSDDSSLTLLSFGGYTLGGIFCVEYQDSPIGPYREVAVLSSLVGSPKIPPAIGAWASHIFVDSQAAADYGREFWGLPASVVPIQFTADRERTCRFSGKEIVVSGWDEAASPEESQALEWLEISLPSFSGLLPMDTTIDSSQTSPLLQYPLSIISPSAVGFDDSKSVLYDADCNNSQIKEVKALLDGSQPLLAASIGGVNLVAGVPTVVE